ncbi:hypothetical protein FGO68_gene6984 [Halteria grandinella]|uniref:RING-type domain-containing protein n=1 Tax=Halteria grandinella TaxID=5974 RepID=A0A8J8T0M8_HALGN|nr:hypothetical protein FGO68_gene6984 [Halteria grandinella]
MLRQRERISLHYQSSEELYSQLIGNNNNNREESNGLVMSVYDWEQPSSDGEFSEEPWVQYMPVRKSQSEKYMCEICMEGYGSLVDKEPVVLGCGHTMCKQCAIKLIKRNKVQCPFDKKIFEIPDHNDLSINYALLSLIEEELNSYATIPTLQQENIMQLEILPSDSEGKEQLCQNIGACLIERGWEVEETENCEEIEDEGREIVNLMQMLEEAHFNNKKFQLDLLDKIRDEEDEYKYTQDIKNLRLQEKDFTLTLDSLTTTIGQHFALLLSKAMHIKKEKMLAKNLINPENPIPESESQPVETVVLGLNSPHMPVGLKVREAEEPQRVNGYTNDLDFGN